MHNYSEQLVVLVNSVYNEKQNGSKVAARMK